MFLIIQFSFLLKSAFNNGREDYFRQAINLANYRETKKAPMEIKWIKKESLGAIVQYSSDLNKPKKYTHVGLIS